MMQPLPPPHYDDRLMGLDNQQLQAENARLRAALNAANQQLATYQGPIGSAQSSYQQMQDEFIAIVSHELRTPLTAAYGALSILVGGLVEINSDQGQQLLNMAAQSTERLVGLINNILDVEITSVAQSLMPLTECPVTELLHPVVQLIQPKADQVGITLNLEITHGPDLMVALANRDRVVQVLVNLMNNAMRFSPPNGVILLKAERCGSQVQFSVQDQGLGIPEDQQAHVFERFQQVDASRARQHDGPGLGLAICRNIIQQHQGEIWLESTIGQGSRFYFTIPLVPLPVAIP